MKDSRNINDSRAILEGFTTVHAELGATPCGCKAPAKRSYVYQD